MRTMFLIDLTIVNWRKKMSNIVVTTEDVQEANITRRQAQALEMVLTPLRNALLENDLDEENIVKKMKALFDDETVRPSDKLTIIKMIAGWGQWDAPKQVEHSVKKIVITGKPEDFNP